MSGTADTRWILTDHNHEECAVPDPTTATTTTWEGAQRPTIGALVSVRGQQWVVSAVDPATDAISATMVGRRRVADGRYGDTLQAPFRSGARYIALHTLSHLLIRTIALEWGYNSASLSERIYAGSADDPRSGILIYTAVPDAEGTLGGLVSLSEPDSLVRLTRRALTDARHCSSDPLCAERLPAAPADFLHGAACHVCPELRAAGVLARLPADS